MNDHQRGYADNYAGVPRSAGLSCEWLAGWDEAQRLRLQDDREIRKVTSDLQNQWADFAPGHRSSSYSVE